MRIRDPSTQAAKYVPWAAQLAGQKKNKTGNVHIQLRRVRVTTVAVENQYVLHTLSVPVALVTQHAKLMRPVLWSSVYCPALQHFSIVSHKWHDLQEGWGDVTGYTVCFDFLYNFCLQQFSFYKEFSVLV